jgi:SAM-dependent methyltransferase
VTVAPDGSPVDLYLLLPPRGEAELVHETIPAGAEVLDLGCGVGRVAHGLVRLGHPVTAVDESPEMLAHVRGADTVCARIEELDLGGRFACVLLMSNLVNDDEHRAAWLAACARHVAEDGVVLVERHPPNWRPEPGTRGRLGEVEVSLEDVHVTPPHVAATVRYATRGNVWRQPFRARVLDDVELADELRRAGLEFERTLDEHGAWVAARLYSRA